VLEELDGSAADLGLVLAAYSLARVGFMLVGGVWADRLDRRTVMVVCDAVRAAVQLFVFAMLAAGAMELWMFGATAALFGGASAFFGPASTALVPEVTSREHLQHANALISITRQAAAIFGPAVSGLLVAAFGSAVVFAVDAATFVVSGAFLLVLGRSSRVPPPRHHFLAELATGFREVTARTWLWVGLLAAAVTNLGSSTFQVLGPLTFAEGDRGGASAWGLVLAAGAVGGVLGGLTGLRWRPGRPLVAAFAAYSLAGVVLAALAIPAALPVIAIAATCYVGGTAAGNVFWETVLQAEIPQEVMARVDSYDWLVSLVFIPIGLSLAGPVAAEIGRGPTLWIGAALASGGMLAALLVPSVRHMRRGTY
jgi:MFS family permease